MVAEGEAEAGGGYAPGGLVPTRYGGPGEPSLMPRRRQSLLRRAGAQGGLVLLLIGAVF